MAASTTTTREPVTTAGGDANPAVLNVRRPNAVFTGAESQSTKPHAELRAFDEAAQPRTVLRLPDLAAAVQRMRKTDFNLAAIAQWVALSLGGLLALWLIFGGRRPSAPAAVEAPPWSPPTSQAEMAVPSAAAEAPAPQWQSSSWDTSPAPDQAAPYPSSQPPPQNGASSPQPPDWNDPNWSDSVNRSAPPSASAANPGMRTAQRYETDSGPTPSSPQSPQVQPLNVTVPVRQ